MQSVGAQPSRPPCCSCHHLSPPQSSRKKLLPILRAVQTAQTPPWLSGFLKGQPLLHSPSKASTHFTWFPRTAYSSGVPPFCHKRVEDNRHHLSQILRDPPHTFQFNVVPPPVCHLAHLASSLDLSLDTASSRKPTLTSLGSTGGLGSVYYT